MVSIDLNRQTSLPKVPASWTGTVTFHCQCGHIYRHDSPATLQFQPENLMRQQERCWAAVGSCGMGVNCGKRGGLPGPPHTVGFVPWPASVAGPLFALALCVCSCLVVIRSSHCTTAPSHLLGGSEGHAAPFFTLAALVLASHKEAESWNSLRLLMINIKA